MLQQIPPPIPAPIYDEYKVPSGCKPVFFDLETTGLGR